MTKLSKLQQIELSKKLELKEVSNLELAKAFNISVAAINYHKAKLKKQKRGLIDPLKSSSLTKDVESKNIKVTKEENKKGAKDFVYIINGTEVRVHGAKSIYISKKLIDINFL
tara:strand:+ start:227 stop:565 length:339 start_codon:yes stop_codon:yes gene_type:complete